MLTSIHAKQINRYGVAKVDEKSGVFTQIVPIKYTKIDFIEKLIFAYNHNGTTDVYKLDGTTISTNSKVVIQKYGIVVTKADGTSNAYTYEAELVLQRGRNVLFLKDNIIFVSDSDYCYVFNYKMQKFICPLRFEKILFFSDAPNKPAKTYSAKLKLDSILASPSYQNYGAHIENLVCGMVNGKWGIYDTTNNKTYADFVYKVMVQLPNSNIGAIDLNGNQVALTPNARN